ncbi:MAG: flagellar motor switch protein FliN [Planctomycetes bacterium]|nr:flagellar motor switch protein FliN [Planctomycetota bacterium]
MADLLDQETIDRILSRAEPEEMPEPEDLPAGPGVDAPDPVPGAPEMNLELLRDVSLKVKVELGRGRMVLHDILRLAPGSVVELEKLAGDPLDIYANDHLIARGEVLVLNENFCVRITEIVARDETKT